jgi:glucose-1-phosphate adenylyltransferase
VLILAGDHIYKMDYGAMLAHHAQCGADVTVACIEVPLADATEFGVVDMDADTRIRNFVEKSPHPQPMPGKPDTALVSMGIYVFNAHFLLEWLHRDAGLSNSSHDFGKDVIPSAILDANVYAYPFRDLYEPQKMGYWRDVGTVDAYWQANIELTDVVPELNLYDERWPIWTRQEQIPPAKFVFADQRGRGQAIDSLVGDGCIVSGAAVNRSVLFINARAEAGSVIEESLLLPGVTVGERCHIRRAIIASGCHIPDGTHIGIDQEADRRHYHVTPGGITLVTHDMLL